VRVHSFCDIQEAVILPDVTIGRGARLRKVVIDRACVIPDGMVVGEDPKADAERFERTDSGVVLITREMLRKLAASAPPKAPAAPPQIAALEDNKG
jgi:glucose-1-phosphate adenylyltransferase